ncbi:MAG: extracellular solute-binding protein [Ruminococcaceae bacterium]|nr:extracellular solute-binding protein [Oscillospiraceae bacterium]
MKKVIAFILSLLCLLVLCGCGTASETVSETTAPTVQEGPVLPDPESVDIDGNFNILIAANWKWNDYEADESSSEVVDVAIYERREKIKEKYGVELTTEDIVASQSTMGSGKGFQKLYNEVMAGYTNYDAAMIGTYDVATLAYNGLLTDLNRVPYVNLNNEYWDQKANKDLSMKGKMYYTTGEISLSDNRSVYTLFFSKNMIDEYGLDNPYDLVKSGNWTIEKFAEMSKSVGSDKNSDSVFDKNDVFGFLTPRDTHLAILSATGEKICSINEDGQLTLTIYNERTSNLYDRYLDILNHSSTYNYQDISGSASSDERIGMFNNSQALFYSHTMFYTDELRQMENNFGILPYPKYDKNQGEYYNLVSPWHSQFVCVPVLNEGLERIGIVLEELAYLGKEMLTPAYYDKTLQGKYARDAESAEMLDIIFDSLLFDVGAYYNIAGLKDEIGKIYTSGKSLTTIYESNRLIAESKIDEINEIFAKRLGY